MLTPAYSTLGIPLIPQAIPPKAAETTCATVLFADLHGYDALVERLPPVQVVSMLEEFFAILTDAVLEWGGQIFHQAEADVMAGFGVGDPRHTQIHEAVAAARTIQRCFAPVRESWQIKHSIDAGIGVGIDRGDVAVGIFRSPDRAALMLVGDAAHVAAQLCRRARAGEVLVSAGVYVCFSAATGPTETTPFLHLPQLRLRGRTTPLDVWCAPAARRLQMRYPVCTGSAAQH